MTKTPPNSPRLLIYCVHGKPREGCCKVSEGEIVDMEPRRSFEELSSHTKESIITTDLVNRHCHKDNTASVDKRARRKLIIASILCVIFMIGEVIGGYMSSSLAIATDAAHLLTDFASFMISLFSLWVGSRPATKKMSFGWYRAEVIGALTSVLMIWVVTGILVYMAVQRVIEKEFEIDAFVMLITSAIGVLVNLIMGCTLHQHGHGHGGGHGHSHGGSIEHGHSHSEAENINVRAAYIHVIGDFIQSFGVFVAAILIYYKPEWSIADPICTFLFSILVLFTTFNIIKDTLQVLMEGIPKGIDFNEVRAIFLSIPGVKRVHNLRIWALSLDKTALSAHLAIEPGTNPQAVLMQATKQIHDKHNFFEMTLQIEEFQDVMKNCRQCNFPE
ncbi:proton-coupled zinc antiporter SLC30A2-like isoform X2 [Atheta coriaria]